jgi:hypothetical protein
MSCTLLHYATYITTPCHVHYYIMSRTLLHYVTNKKIMKKNTTQKNRRKGKAYTPNTNRNVYITDHCPGLKQALQ